MHAKASPITSWCTALSSSHTSSWHHMLAIVHDHCSCHMPFCPPHHHIHPARHRLGQQSGCTSSQGFWVKRLARAPTVATLSDPATSARFCLLFYQLYTTCHVLFLAVNHALIYYSWHHTKCLICWYHLRKRCPTSSKLALLQGLVPLLEQPTKV